MGDTLVQSPSPQSNVGFSFTDAGRRLSMHPSEQKGSQRRTERACGRCKLKKTKCDGNTPCQKCEAADASCVYESKRKKPERPICVGYVEHLELQHLLLSKTLKEMWRRYSPHQENGESTLDAIAKELGTLPDAEQIDSESQLFFHNILSQAPSPPIIPSSSTSSRSSCPVNPTSSRSPPRSNEEEPQETETTVDNSSYEVEALPRGKELLMLDIEPASQFDSYSSFPAVTANEHAPPPTHPVGQKMAHLFYRYPTKFNHAAHDGHIGTTQLPPNIYSPVKLMPREQSQVFNPVTQRAQKREYGHVVEHPSNFTVAVKPYVGYDRAQAAWEEMFGAWKNSAELERQPVDI